MSEAITVRESTAIVQAAQMSVSAVADRVNAIHEIMERVMKNGTHYGTIPGCGGKPVLLKPGADLLAMAFKLAPEYDITRTDLPNGHREYEVKCVMRSTDGTKVAEGIGTGSTMEKKYRYFRDGKERADVADVYNTVMKMAKKRAHVDCTLTATGAADMFTQDIIESDAEIEDRAPIAEPVPKNIQTITGTIEDVQTKPSTRSGQPATRYGITIDGVTLGTFDEDLGKLAAVNQGNEATATYAEHGKVKDMLTLTVEG